MISMVTWMTYWGDQLFSQEFSETPCLRKNVCVLSKYYTLNPKFHLLNWVFLDFYDHDDIKGFHWYMNQIEWYSPMNLPKYMFHHFKN